VLTAAQILERLGSSLDLLTAGSRDSPERQRTLRATIDWSFQLLSDYEKSSLVRLAVFAGSFDLEAAESVARTEIEALASLVDKSLLRQTEEGRFFMLETIRAFALDLLDGSVDEAELRQRHAEFQLARSASTVDEEARSLRDRLEPDYADIRQALVWFRGRGDNTSLLRLASQLGRFWDFSGYLIEGRQWLEVALSLAPPAVSRDRASAFARVAHIAWRQGEYDHARTALAQAERLAQELDDRRLMADIFAYRAGLEVACDRLDDAARAYETAIGFSRACGDLRGVAISVHDLGLISLERGDYVRAREYVQESLSLCRDQGYEAFAGAAVGTLGYIEFCDGDLDEAHRLLKVGLTSELEKRTLTLSTAHDLYVFAAVVAHRERFDAAAMLVGASDGAFERAGARREKISNHARHAALSTAMTGIGEPAVTRFVSKGTALTLADAVEYALALD
jgi:tetratricopeptide (TPR) repeat protein